MSHVLGNPVPVPLCLRQIKNKVEKSWWETYRLRSVAHFWRSSGTPEEVSRST